jgi:hypothetical protein
VEANHIRRIRLPSHFRAGVWLLLSTEGRFKINSQGSQSVRFEEVPGVSQAVQGCFPVAGQMLADKIYPFFLGTWVVLAVASWLFYRYASIASRRKRHGYWVGGSVGIIGVFFLAMSADWPTFPFVLLLVIPSMAWMAWLSYRRTRFCLSCESVLAYQPFQASPDYCPKCGAPTTSV